MAGVLCLMACNKVENPSNSNNLSAVASIDTQTKTVYTDNGAGNGMKVDWAESESFKAYYSNSDYLTFNKKGRPLLMQRMFLTEYPPRQSSLACMERKHHTTED